MRIIRVAYGNTTFYAKMDNGMVTCMDQSKGISGPIPIDQVEILPPVVPSKIICLAVNYRAHAEEVNMAIPDEPIIFFKPPSAVIRHHDPIIMPASARRVDFEGELAVVVGRPCKNIEPEQVPAHVFGYTCANDVTCREMQKKDGQFARSKGFDTFCPIGPWIETEVRDPSDLALRTYVNGELKQDGNTSDMIFDPFTALSFVSKVMSLTPGDVLITGTPPGIAPLADGDTVAVDIEGVGRLENPVRAETMEENGKDEGPLQ
jgi:2-keto-4-pentenoate hydratase/2-oxohepta-3-ene-1,7-dioic acid hydratase in catechol pathway